MHAGLRLRWPWERTAVQAEPHDGLVCWQASIQAVAAAQTLRLLEEAAGTAERLVRSPHAFQIGLQEGRLAYAAQHRPS